MGRASGPATRLGEGLGRRLWRGLGGLFAGVFRRLNGLRPQFALVIAAAMAPAGVLAVLQALANLQTQADQLTRLVEAEARAAAEEERGALIEIRESLRNAAIAVEKAHAEGGGCAGVLEPLATAHAWLASVVLVNDKGQAVCGGAAGLELANPPEWEDFARWPRFRVGAARTGQLSGRRVLAVYHPLPRGAPGAFALVAGLDLAFLRTLAETGAGDLPFALMDGEGETAAENSRATAGWLPADGRAALRPAYDRTVRARGADGIERLYVSQPLVPGQFWAVAGARPVETWQILLSREGVGVLAPILLWVIAVGVAYVAIDQLVTRHVAYLQRVATRIGRGDLETEIRGFETAPTEIAGLGEAVRTMARNIAERDARLRDALAVQRSLLLEVHHRVKNNLQTISSLMNFQLRRSRSEAERRSLQLVQDRIHGLALVHQNLYATERLDSLALERLVRDICCSLEASLRPARAEVAFDFALAPLTVAAEIATPVALFLTEAVSNVFKHAVGEGRRTAVRVRLAAEGQGFALTLENDAPTGSGVGSGSGPGPEEGGLEASSGIGSRLMEGFARQIGGRMLRGPVPGGYRVTLVGPSSVATTRFELHRREAAARLAEAAAGAAGQG